MRTSTISRASAGVAAIAVVVGIGFGTASPAAAHGACRSPVERVTDLRASRRVSCAGARKVAAAYDAKVMDSQSFPGGNRVKVRGFTCATTSTGHEAQESFSVRCATGRNVVSFQWGV